MLPRHQCRLVTNHVNHDRTHKQHFGVFEQEHVLVRQQSSRVHASPKNCLCLLEEHAGCLVRGGVGLAGRASGHLTRTTTVNWDELKGEKALLRQVKTRQRLNEDGKEE